MLIFLASKKYASEPTFLSVFTHPHPIWTFETYDDFYETQHETYAARVPPAPELCMFYK